MFSIHFLAYDLKNLKNKNWNWSKNSVIHSVDYKFRLFFFIASRTLAKLAVFFLAVVFDIGIGRCTRIDGDATSSIKSNSKFLLLLWKTKDAFLEKEKLEIYLMVQHFFTYCSVLVFFLISASATWTGVGCLRPGHFHVKSIISPLLSFWYILSNSSGVGSNSSFSGKQEKLHPSVAFMFLSDDLPLSCSAIQTLLNCWLIFDWNTISWRKHSWSWLNRNVKW